MAALTTASIASLTTAGVASLSTSGIVGLTTAGTASLTTASIVSLTTGQTAALKTASVASLTTQQVAVLETADLASLTSRQIGVLTTASVASLTTANIVALTTAQTAALTTASIASLTTASVASLETSDVVALKTSQVSSLTTASVASLLTAQVAILTTHQVEALTSTQIQALSTTQVAYLKLGTPIVLDLDEDGVKTLSISSGTQFDLFAKGQKVNTGWVSSSDGLLALDRNHDGKIGDGSELFGSSTILSNGEKANDGYVALRELDNNSDGAITKDDAEWSNLRVWVDNNSDGISEDGETRTLDSLGVTKLNLNAESAFTKDNGNLIGLTSSYETADGTSHAMADVWFVANKDQDLRTQVSGLTQAIATFNDSQSGVANNEGSSITAPLSGTQQGGQTVVVNVGGIVDTLKQFDANGNLVTNAVQSSGSLQAGVGEQSSLIDAQDPTKTGFLVSK